MPIRDEAELVIKVTGKGSENIENFTKKVKAADDASSDLAQTLLGLFSTAAVVQFGKESIRVFSDLEETTAKFYEVFKGVESAANQAAQTLIDRFGASELSAKSMLSQTGDLLVGFGFARDEALKLSERVAQLGADIASFSNYAGGAEGATYAITKAMLGETEQAKMLGIAIKTDSEEYKQIYNRIKETQGVTETQAKALTALEIAFQQKGDAMGDFERTMGSIANQGRILDNQLVELKTNVGRGLQGAFSDAQGSLINLLTEFNNLDKETQDFIVQTGAIFSGLLAVKTAYMTNNVLIRLNSVLMGENTSSIVTNTDATEANTKAKIAGASAARGLGAAMAGLAKSFVPLLIASAAIEGLLYLMTKSAKEAEALANSAGDLAQQARQARQAHEEAIPVEREMVERYEELVSQTNRSKEEEEELARITDQLNEKYKDLQLSILGTANAYAKLSAEQKKAAIELLEKEAQAAKEAFDAQVERFKQEANEFGDYAAFLFSFGSASDQIDLSDLLSATTSSLNSLEEAERTLDQIRYIRNEAIKKGEADLAGILGEIEMQTKAYIEAKKKLQEAENGGIGNSGPQSDEGTTYSREGAYEAHVKGRREREKLKRDFERSFLSPQARLWEEEKDLQKELEETKKKQFKSEVERQKALNVILLELEKNRIDQKKLLIEEEKDYLEQLIWLTEDKAKRKIDELKNQIDVLKKEEEARKELIDSFSSSTMSYRSTLQDSINARSMQAIQIQSRMFISGGSDSVQALQKKVAENSEAQKKIMEEIESIEQKTKEAVEEIRSKILNLSASTV